MSFRYCSNIAVSQLERCSKGGKISFWGAKIFGMVYFSSSFLLISKKRRKKGLDTKLVFFSPKFLLDLKKKKKNHLAKLLCLFPSFLLLPKKKATILKQPQGKGVFGWACWNF